MQPYHQFKTPRTLEATIKNHLLEIDAFNQAYWGFARRFGVGQAVNQTMILAFDELLSNIINYAYHDDDEHQIEIRIDLTNETVIATITDDGIPFNPLQRQEPDTTLSLKERKIGGLGIHLVRQIIDEVNYERRDNKNVVTLIQHQ